MKNLTIINQNGKLLVDSREVAEMTGKRHDHLIRDIDGYVAVLNQTPNLGADHFFIESSYSTGTGKPYKCYLLTKKGCDMVANKMTGEKGVLFTAAYVTMFEEMERKVINPYTGLSKELQAIFAIDQRTQIIESRLEHLEDNMTIDYGQQLSLQKLAKKRALVIMSGDKSPAYLEKNLRSKVFSALWNDFKEYFNVSSYKDTPTKDFDKAMDYVAEWKPQGKLLRAIEETNQQISF